MLADSQTDTYFERMGNSAGDKMRLIPYIRDGKVLDIGAGGGELAEMMRLYGNDVTALDGSPNAIHHMNDKFPLLNAVEGFSDDMVELFEEESFDTIVCSSILHEIFSYGGKDTETIDHALKDIFTLLKPGGRLLIRDGVMPTSHAQSTSVVFATKDGPKFMELYKNTSPFYSDVEEYRKVSFTQDNPTTFSMPLGSLMETLYTYTWGFEAAGRETQELYGIFTEQEYCDELVKNGFNVVTSYQYTQPGYPENLKHKVSIFDSDGNEIEYPSSNMVIVAEKPI